MEKIIQEVVAIIDRSGSMNGKENDTIGGINSAFQLLKDEKEENVDIKVSVKLFDDKEELLFRSIDLESVRPLTTKQFVPRGQTALLDAIGNTLTYFMQKKLFDNNSYTNCLIYITTDGYENCSKIYTHDKIKKMINEAEKYNINVIYLAANQDAIFEASRLGIDSGNALNYSENTQNVESAYRYAASVSRRVRSGLGSNFTNAERSASQNNDYVQNYSPPPLRRQRTTAQQAVGLE